ncbi:MAG: Gfo/Idh/MocA family oxidoreductase, partial [Planctomycetota bacterium]|nr:Gfo/Idh/MocA family oxidoreductase [Planctomycetota bacterium]
MSLSSVLVIGVGSIGERHTRCFLKTGRAEVSIVEINASLRQAVAERYHVAQFESLDHALRNPPQIAVVCTPAPFHIPITTQLLNAGVHVLVEKPLSTSDEGIDGLEELATARGLTVSVAYVYRAFPELNAARELLHSGQFGPPLEVTVVGGQHFPTYRPAYREIYYARREMGGGAIQDAITHLL